MEFLELVKNIDWLFAFVILIGGRYWGSRYLKVFKKPDYNFLLFATIFGAIWIAIQKVGGKITQDHVGSLFLTYLFTTSFYQILAKRLFEWVEEKFGYKQPEP